MSTALGIDFGSSQCCAYVVKNGALELVPSPTGAPTTPSWVAFTGNGTLVGQRARSLAPSNPTHTVFGVKRLLGRKFCAPETTWLRDAMPVDLLPASNGDAWFHIGGMARSPQELASYLLEHVKQRAELLSGEPIESAVLSIPPFFDERQRRAILEAAELAGLGVERLLHSPTAAAIAHSHRNPQLGGRWAVLDLGAGSLDVSVVDVDDGRFEVLSAVGDPLLGGDDFDRHIAERLIDHFYEEHGVHLGEDPAAVHRLFEAARTAKHELSDAARSSAINLPAIARVGDRNLQLYADGIERSVFEDLVGEELDRIAEPCALALEDLGFGTDDMHEVLLIGGMARVPAVQRTVTYLYRVQPTLPPNGPMMPAMGAALFAASRRGDVPPILLDEVSPHSIGIKTAGGHFSPVIHRRSLVPCREQKIFTAARRQQSNVVFEVYQGEGALVNENVYLGRFTMDTRDERHHVTVAFNLDENGVLSIAAGGGRAEERVTLHASCGLAADEILRLVEERVARSRIAPNPAPQLSISARAPESSPPPPSDGNGEPTPSTRPGPRRSVPPPRELPKTSAPPPGFGNAKTKVDRGGDSSRPAPIEMADDSLVGTTVGGRYVIEDIIADGGMGRVYLARHDVLNKKFALKVLHAELAQNDDLAGRFVREAQAAARIQSPHVVDISDFGRLPDGTGYFVMEYLAGTTLAKLVYDRGALPAKLIIDVATQLTDGLAVAHDIGIVHRDLKPDNVTLIQRGGHPYFCKILDFGIAKAPTSDSHKHETLAGTLLGTPHYMAPEQIDGVHMDARCDIYSLGAVMYELATGRPPFDAETLVGVLVKHKTEQPMPVRSHEIAAQCPIELQAVIHRCLAKSPADRYQSARALNAALKAI